MFTQRITLAGLVLVLAACLGACSEQTRPTPRAEEAAKSAETSPKEQILEKFRASAPFTLDCQGKYNLTDKDGNARTGIHRFSISIVPKDSVAYLFAFGAGGTYDKRLEQMNEEITAIGAVSEQHIDIGTISLNRISGKYEAAGDTSIGMCLKAESYKEIPHQKF